MAVKFIAGHHRYSGLSTDTKPTAPPVGSTFKETDSGKSYAWDGTSWNIDFPVIDGLYTGVIATIDVSHYEIHEGDHYHATYTETLASGSASNVMMQTPASAIADVHFFATLSTSAAGSINFQEGPNATAGTVVTIYNSKRMSGNTAETIVTQNGAITSAGTILSTGYTGGGASGKVGGETGLRNEWILNHSTRYILQFVSSAASVVCWNLFWYEED